MSVLVTWLIHCFVLLFFFSIIYFVFPFLVLCFRFEFCVSVLSFVILFWVLRFCFGFCDSVVGFVILSRTCSAHAGTDLGRVLFGGIPVKANNFYPASDQEVSQSKIERINWISLLSCNWVSTLRNCMNDLNWSWWTPTRPVQKLALKPCFSSLCCWTERYTYLLLRRICLVGRELALTAEQEVGPIPARVLK